MRDYETVRTCRFCKKIAWTADMVKYGTRCYAHFKCYGERKTMRDADKLSRFQRERLDAWWVAQTCAPEADDADDIQVVGDD